MRVQRIELCAQPWEGYILTTIRYPRIVWSRCPDLNRRPTLYESAALPTELQRHDCAPTDYTIPHLRNKLIKGVASEAKSWYDTWSLGKTTRGLVVKLAYHASLSRRRSPVRIRSGPPRNKFTFWWTFFVAMSHLLESFLNLAKNRGIFVDRYPLA